MISPVPPIFVVEWPDNVDVYKSVEDAALSLEPWWVEQGLGAAYDAEGRLLEFGIDKYNVVIDLGEQDPTHASELTWILRSFLTALGEDLGEDSACSLSSLVRRCAKRSGTPSS